MDAAGRSIPWIGTSAGGRLVSTSRRVKAQAIGSGESLVTSTSVHPPPSATVQTRWMASPPGMRSRVSQTGAPAQLVLAHGDLVGGAVPAIVGGDVPVEGSRAVLRDDRTPGRDVGAPWLTERARDHGP